MTIDLKTAAGRRLLLDLAAEADVLVQNFRPGVVERLGVGEADIRAAAPDIVYVSISASARSGRMRQADLRSDHPGPVGADHGAGGSDEERPRLVRTVLPDKLTAITAAQAISTALFARERTGVAQHVRLSMLDSVMAFLWASDMGAQTFVDRPVSNQRAASFIDLIYETKTAT